jgi:hypothetical protein
MSQSIAGTKMSAIGKRPASCRSGVRGELAMSLLLILLIVLLVFGGGGLYLGGPRIGGSVGGLILLLIIVLALTGRL